MILVWNWHGIEHSGEGGGYLCREVVKKIFPLWMLQHHVKVHDLVREEVENPYYVVMVQALEDVHL